MHLKQKNSKFFKPWVILPLVIFIVIVFVFARQAKANKDAAFWVAHTQEVLFRSEKLFAVLTDAETSLRAYLLTGTPYFYQHFKEAKIELPIAFNTILQLTADNAVQQATLTNMRKQVLARISVADSAIAVKINDGPKAALETVIQRKGGHYLDAMRNFVDQIQGREAGLLTTRKNTSSIEAKIELATFSAIIVLLLGLLIILFKKETQLASNTERKKSEAMFSALLESAPDVMIIVNEKGEVILANHQTEVLFNYTKSELIGQQIEVLIPEAFIFEYVQSLGKSSKTVVTNIELAAIRKNAGFFPVEVNFSPIQIDKQVLVIASVRDITDRKKAVAEIDRLNVSLEEKVLSRTAALRAANNEMEAFTYSVSHDLRAPLRGIIGFTTILEDEYSSSLDEEARRITSIIKNNTTKMGNLIDGLLSFSRMVRQQIIKIDVAMDGLVAEAIAESANKNNDSIEWVISPLPNIKGDPFTIRQVWANLISNAIKYSKRNEHPKIEIGWQKEVNETIYFVKDNGIGFDIKYKEKLFKVFQRLHAATEFEGTGVGLAIVEKIITKHGGKIWADAAIGQGACFYFSLPNNG